MNVESIASLSLIHVHDESHDDETIERVSWFAID